MFLNLLVSLTYPKNTYEVNVDFKKKGESGHSGPFGGLFKNLFKPPAGGWFQHPFKASHSFSHSFQHPFHPRTTKAPVTTTTTEITDFGETDFGTDSDIKEVDFKDISEKEERVKIEPIVETNSGAEANTNEHAGYDKNSQEIPVRVETKEEIEAGNVILDVNSLSNSGYDDNIIEITTHKQSHGYENHAHDVSIETIPLIYLPPTQDPPRLYLPSN